RQAVINGKQATPEPTAILSEQPLFLMVACNYQNRLPAFGQDVFCVRESKNVFVPELDHT
ncbi:MAG: hypothetical protein FWH35_07015, partial [Treponema sp.]|nr:hypothetical protein [Treponema sp.]